jgi:hypothetical protein
MLLVDNKNKFPASDVTSIISSLYDIIKLYYKVFFAIKNREIDASFKRLF